jgi:hypothetical protein
MEIEKGIESRSPALPQAMTHSASEQTETWTVEPLAESINLSV